MKTAALSLWKVALLGFVAMCVQDILGTTMVIFESHAGSTGNIWVAMVDGIVAGCFDVGGWITGLICAALAIESIISEGWRTTRSLVIIGAVSAANLIGTFAGVLIAFAITHPTH